MQQNQSPLTAEEIAFINHLNSHPRNSSHSLDRWALIVEDDGLIRSELASAISRMGILCWHAANLGEARRLMMDDPPPSIVFLDLRLPDGSGMELLKDPAFRSWRAHHGIQVVVITGHGTPVLAEEARTQGAFAFLNKPVTIRQLREITRASLDVHDALVSQ
ncbi:response regulator [Ectothiorhodospira shaposhnikovii]|uniref:response regulator n=1 Tax=Ectothiorhodospira shaposhnikovii TaxID=1054 RepID=UPI001EE7B055|nr:response regulator [Ectothiorhodospira shaposhnikovii]MCG5512765.1 response regulator [Ectothiorhodospira shaposhnikovii]